MLICGKQGTTIRFGVFHFEEGTSGSMVTSDNADGYVGADAVRWLLVQH
jgi:hypothetical protein